MRASLLVLLVLSLASSGHADERADRPEVRAAKAAIAAFDAEDSEALRKLAEVDRPDPWDVADALWARGRIDVARAFAKAAPRGEVERLPAYLDEAAKHAPSTEMRNKVLEAVAQFRQNRKDAAIAIFKTIDTGWPSVTNMIGLTEIPPLLAQLGRLPEAEVAAKRAGEAAEGIGWYTLSLDMRIMQLRLLTDLGRIDEALAVRKAAIPIAAKLRVPTALARLHLHTGRALLARHRNAEAADAYQLAIDALDDRPSPLLISATIGLGNAQGEMADAIRSIATYERAYEIAESIGHAAYAANALTNIAISRAGIGNPGGALPPLLKALELTDAKRAPSNVASTYHQLSEIYWDMGRYADALDAMDKAVVLARKSGHPAAIAASDVALASYLGFLGQQGRRRALLEGVLKSAETGRIHPQFHAQVHGDMAELDEREGDLASARAHRRAAVAVLERTGQIPWVVNAEEMLADFESRTGNTEAATKILRGVIARREGIGMDAANAGARLSLAAILFATDLDEAGVQLTKAEALAKAGGDMGMLQSATVVRASWHVRRKEWATALATLKRGMSMLEGLGRGLDAESGAGARDLRRKEFELGVGIAADMGDVDEVLRFVEAGRAEGLIESLAGRDAVRAATLPPALVAAEAEARARVTAAQHAVRRSQESSSRKARRDARKALEEAQAAREAVAARVDRAAKRTRDLTDVEPADRAALQKTLSPGEVLVLYAQSQRRMLALRITPDAVRLLDIGTREDVAKAARALDPSTPDADVKAATDALRTMLIAPLALTAKETRLHISPAAALAYVPFSMLLPDRDVVHIPSGTTRTLLLAERDARGTGVLGLGDPDYGKVVQSEKSTVRGGRLAPLPGTRVEVEAVADVRLLRADATMSALREALAKRERWRSVHFACHGLVDAERPMRSSLALTPEAATDGVLSALDVMRMQIPADVAVLSACETGRGKVFHSEGVMGLTRAFMHAGAPRIVCSLWKVDDEATRALMIKLYELWDPEEGESMPLAAALRQAQAHVRAQPKWAHPYYWSAWQLWGLGR